MQPYFVNPKRRELIRRRKLLQPRSAPQPRSSPQPRSAPAPSPGSFRLPSGAVKFQGRRGVWRPRKPRCASCGA